MKPSMSFSVPSKSIEARQEIFLFFSAALLLPLYLFSFDPQMCFVLAHGLLALFEFWDPHITRLFSYDIYQQGRRNPVAKVHFFDRADKNDQVSAHTLAPKDLDGDNECCKELVYVYCKATPHEIFAIDLVKHCHILKAHGLQLQMRPCAPQIRSAGC